jgi:hypothetical protein
MSYTSRKTGSKATEATGSKAKQLNGAPLNGGRGGFY